MSTPKFTVIQGGLSASKNTMEKQFAGAYITNTRLMGVMGMYVHWKLTEFPSCPDFHQFFYFDAEEYGFESYRSVTGNKVEAISAIEQTMINGLGGRKVELSEREVRAVLWKYVLFNQAHNIPLPEKLEEYEFLLDEPVEMPPTESAALLGPTPDTPDALSTAEAATLISKICDQIRSPEHAINYFLMRCFGHDYEAASWLATDEVPLRLYEDQHPQATFCKNIIDLDEDKGGFALEGCDVSDFDVCARHLHPGSKAYLCESLIEYDGTYHLVVSRVSVDPDLRVCGFEPCSGFMISSAEAAMMLAKPEFITVYEVLIPVDEFATLLSQVPLNCMITPHQNGKVFMMFHNHNDHVNQQTFMLSADVAGIYYLSDAGQLLAVAYDLPAIHALEKDLRKSVLAPYVVTTGKYEFKEPVLYDFIESQFEDFDEFLEFIQV